MVLHMRWGVAILVALLAAACSGSSLQPASSATLSVVAAENFWGSLATELGGAKVSVQSVVTDPNADPHEYESSSADARAFADARLVILNGAGYDTWGQKLVDANPSAGRQVLNIADLLGKKNGDNPHFWYSPAYVNHVADEITAHYRSIDAADASYFEQQRQDLTAAFRPMTDELATIKQRYAGTAIGSTESVFVYMASALGLDLTTPAEFMNSVAEGNHPAGPLTAVLGPNGSGKTTLLRLILGQLSPAAGSMEVFGHAPRRGDPGIGYVPQRSDFDPELSIRGRDFVGLGLDGHRWGIRLFGDAAGPAVQHSIDAVGAGADADHALGRLSGGEQQRLLLAQALVGNPRLLLTDDPLSYLDVRSQSNIVQLVAGVAARRDLTVIFIAHDVNPLLRHIDNVVYVASGRVAMGRPDEIITTESLTHIYNTPVEVIKDSRGRVFVVGLEEEVAHPHA